MNKKRGLSGGQNGKSRPENRNGRLFIISAPSGSGKTTLCKVLFERFPDIRFSVSYTTRPSRPGDREGKDYYFITKEAFTKGIKAGEWAEWAQVHDNFYGTSAEFLDSTLSSGHDILLDIDVQGAVQILQRYPESITIFIMPPSLKILKNRLEERGADSQDTIATRMRNAEKEIAEKDRYQYIIVNDKLSDAAEELISIVKKVRSEE